MKIVFYFLTFLFGLLGAVSALRSIELLMAGAGIKPVQLLLGIVFLILAAKCFSEARTPATT